MRGGLVLSDLNASQNICSWRRYGDTCYLFNIVNILAYRNLRNCSLRCSGFSAHIRHNSTVIWVYYVDVPIYIEYYTRVYSHIVSNLFNCHETLAQLETIWYTKPKIHTIPFHPLFCNLLSDINVIQNHFGFPFKLVQNTNQKLINESKTLILLHQNVTHDITQVLFSQQQLIEQIVSLYPFSFGFYYSIYAKVSHFESFTSLELNTRFKQVTFCHQPIMSDSNVQ